MNYNYRKDEKSKHIFLSVTALICFLLASSVLPFLSSVKGSIPTADIMLCFVCALPAFTDVKKAAIYALALGFLADLFINPPSAFSPLVFLAGVCLASFCQKHFSRVGTLVIAISTIPCTALKSAVVLAVSLLNVGGSGIFGKALSALPITLIVDFACAIVLSFVMRVIGKRLRLR